MTNNTINKAEVVAQMANTSGLSKEDSSKALDAFIKTVMQALHNHKNVRLVGFGSFCIGSRKAITARNPRTGQTIQVPATNFPKFKPGKLLKKAVE